MRDVYCESGDATDNRKNNKNSVKYKVRDEAARFVLQKKTFLKV